MRSLLAARWDYLVRLEPGAECECFSLQISVPYSIKNLLFLPLSPMGQQDLVFPLNPGNEKEKHPVLSHGFLKTQAGK